jgi:hypothetical protein
MRKTLVRLAGLSVVATAVASGTDVFGQLPSGLVPQGSTGQASAPRQSAYTVTPQAGPYLICATCYNGHAFGDKAQTLAEELVREIRTRYGLQAYVFNHATEQRRQEKERIDRQLADWRKRAAEAGALPESKPPPVKTHHIYDQYAVFVGIPGGYKDQETARKDLDRIRKLQPSQQLMHNAVVPDSTGKMREQPLNPFLNAFVSPNPTVPVDKPAADNQTGERLKEYNADEKFSLLKCPKPYTLVVKSYQGAAVVQAQSTSPSVMEKAWSSVFGMKGANVLNANAKQAHEVAEVLRKIGFESYVLHTEYSSYITVGAFDTADDPRLAQMQQAFMNQLRSPGSSVGQLHAYTNFFAQPMPMQVPRVK